MRHGTVDSNLLSCEALELKAGYRTLIRNFSASVSTGEAVAIVGPNGLGKTTLLRSLCGVARPHRGQVKLNGYQLWPEKDHALATDICYLASQPALFQEHTVASNLEFYARAKGRSWNLFEATEVLTKVGLADRFKQTVRSLSTGQKRRLTIAFLLLVKPNLMFLDEPTNGLDSAGKELFFKSVTELRQNGAAILVATHDLELTEWCGTSWELSRWLP